MNQNGQAPSATSPLNGVAPPPVQKVPVEKDAG
jgi:hypothetical protein